MSDVGESAGERLRRQVEADYDLGPDEQALLTEACRTADELDSLEAALAEGPLMMPGSMGQSRPNPLLAEVRAHRLLLAKLLGELALPAEGEEEGLTPAQERARKAARARWEMVRARRGAA